MNKPTISNQHGGDPGWPAKDPDGGKSGGGRKNAVRRKPYLAKGKGGGKGNKPGPNWPSKKHGKKCGGGRDNNPPKKKQ